MAHPLEWLIQNRTLTDTKCWGGSRGTRTSHIFLVNVLRGTSQQKIVCYNVKHIPVDPPCEYNTFFMYPSVGHLDFFTF